MSHSVLDFNGAINRSVQDSTKVFCCFLTGNTVSPSSALSGMTPSECLYGYKSKWLHYKNVAVMHMQTHRKNWDNKAHIGIHVGE